MVAEGGFGSATCGTIFSVLVRGTPERRPSTGPSDASWARVFPCTEWVCWAGRSEIRRFFASLRMTSALSWGWLRGEAGDEFAVASACLGIRALVIGLDVPAVVRVTLKKGSSFLELTSVYRTESLILVGQFAATWAMVGLIWVVQVVQYPLLGRVGPEEFQRYHNDYTRLVAWVVGPLMLVELLTAVASVWWRPAVVPLWAALVGLLLLGVTWASTAFVQVPQHDRLARGFEEDVWRRLVATNWLRTISWTLRGFLMAWMVLRAAG